MQSISKTSCNCSSHFQERTQHLDTPDTAEKQIMNNESNTPVAESGRPKDVTGRIETEIRTYDLLDSLNIPYMRFDHEAAFTIDACNGADEVLGSISARTSSSATPRRRNSTFSWCLDIRNSKRGSLQTDRFRETFFCGWWPYEGISWSDSRICQHHGTHEWPWEHVKLLIDSDVLKDEYFGCHPCINTTSMKLKTSDIMEKFLPAVHHEPTIVDLPWEE